MDLSRLSAPKNATKKNLPKKADKQKDGKCLYRVRVDYITTLQVHRPSGYTDDEGHTGIPRSSRAGDTGFINGSSPAGSEFTGFNSMAAALSFAAGVQQEIDGKNNSGEGGWTVGNREALLVFPPLGAEPVPPGSPPCVQDTSPAPKMVSFDQTV